ncbi:hypothetical protein SAMN06295879_2943 [Agreia bicolorata]|uniref:Uncharacterized protein n=2 Tax=Agreia bicolorata TaxID=110935 RepID=A0A1T4YEH2_9MICO|nr:hypothetical protein SAMN06295879_2943 [Agreia bicolorata]
MHGGMLVPASVSVCCAVGAPRAQRVQGLIVGVAMLLAMADGLAASPMLPALVWAALLVLLAISTSAISSVSQRHNPLPGVTTVTTHRALALILTASLLVAGSAGPTRSTASIAVGAHHHGVGGEPFALVLVVATTLYVGYSAVAIWLGVRSRSNARSNRADGRQRRRLSLGIVDIAAMAASTSVMAIMVTLPS